MMAHFGHSVQLLSLPLPLFPISIHGHGPAHSRTALLEPISKRNIFSTQSVKIDFSLPELVTNLVVFEEKHRTLSSKYLNMFSILTKFCCNSLDTAIPNIFKRWPSIHYWTPFSIPTTLSRLVKFLRTGITFGSKYCLPLINFSFLYYPLF